MSRLAVAATIGALLAGSVASGATTERPALRFIRIDPLIVRGLGFRSSERVAVTARVPHATRTTHVVANVDGAFRVRLGRVPAYDPCASTLSVQARGSLGSRAFIRTLPRLCAVRQP
jgi:hypothetical protein